MRGASAQIVFGFEYAVLLTMVAHITINYLLHLHDLRSPHPWEMKAVYMFPSLCPLFGFCGCDDESILIFK